MWFAGEAGRLLGEHDVTEMAYEAMQPYADLWVVDGIGGACFGAASLQLGRLATALGRRDEAKAWLTAALEDHRRGGAHLLVRFTEQAIDDAGIATGAKEPPPARGEFRHEGRLWRLTWRDEQATVPDSKGMRDVALLLRSPGREVAAIDLVGRPSGQSSGEEGDIGPQLDRRARDEYRRRLVDLEEELTQAEAGRDAGRTSKLVAERDFLAAELAAAVGLGGRARVAGDPAERARKAVTMRVGTALKAIAEVHPALARHLRASISTGRFCAYRPEDPVTWEL